MAKTIFCFICKKPVKVKDDRAIAKLCPEHDNKANKETMVNTPIRQLLAIQDEGLQLMLKNNQDATKLDMNSVLTAIEDIKAQIAALPTETTIVEKPVTDSTLAGNSVNEFGEII